MSNHPVSFDDILDASTTTRYQVISTAERRNILAAAMTAWIDSLPPADCHCILSHHDTDGQVTVPDPECPHHGGLT